MMIAVALRWRHRWMETENEC